MHRLISLARDEAIDGAAIFSSRTLSSSAPVALLEGMDSIICCVCLGVIGGKFNLQSECKEFLSREKSPRSTITDLLYVIYPQLSSDCMVAKNELPYKYR